MGTLSDVITLKSNISNDTFCLILEPIPVASGLTATIAKHDAYISGYSVA